MFKKNILTGLLVLIPIVLTLWVLSNAHPIFRSSIIISFLKSFSLMSFLEERFPAMALSYTCSCFSYRGIANNFFGKKIISIYEYVLNKVPVISSIYKGIKQVSDTLLSNSGQAFSKAVLIEFPNAGTYTFAFVTGCTK